MHWKGGGSGGGGPGGGGEGGGAPGQAVAPAGDGGGRREQRRRRRRRRRRRQRRRRRRAEQVEVDGVGARRVLEDLVDRPVGDARLAGRPEHERDVVLDRQQEVVLSGARVVGAAKVVELRRVRVRHGVVEALALVGGRERDAALRRVDVEVVAEAVLAPARVEARVGRDAPVRGVVAEGREERHVERTRDLQTRLPEEVGVVARTDGDRHLAVGRRRPGGTGRRKRRGRRRRRRGW